MSKESAEFLWHRLFHYLILDALSDEIAKRQMVAVCQKYYARNAKTVQEIDEFERDYSRDHVLQWYTRECFASRMVNSALKTEDLAQLHNFQFFISDLSKHLAHKHKKFFVLVKKSPVVEVRL